MYKLRVQKFLAKPPFTLGRLTGFLRALCRHVGIVTIVVVVTATSAQAQVAASDPTQILQAICTFILGPFGKSIAVLGIVAIGLSWMFGRASLGLIAGVVGGIVLMFGASFLGTTLLGSGG